MIEPGETAFDEDLHDPRAAVQGRQEKRVSADGMAVLLPPYEGLIEGAFSERVQGNICVFGVVGADAEEALVELYGLFGTGRCL
jgi:hypothetical protein